MKSTSRIMVLTAALGTGLGVAALALAALLSGASAQQPTTYSGPLVITKGGTYRGNWESLDPKVPVILIQTRQPVIIENSNLRGRGNLIRGFDVDLTVRNTNGYGLNPQTEGGLPGRFLAVEYIYNLRAENNYLEGTSGMYINGFKGDTAKGQTIKIFRNKVRNVDGRYVDGKGKITGKRYLVQALQLNNVVKVPNIEIAWNEIINEPGKSAAEENINIYATSGTADSPIKVYNNYIQGAYAVDPLRDKEYSGGGIMIGDGSPDNLDTAGGYVEVYRNQVVSTSNQGIAIAGGHDQHVYENRILSSGRLPDGSIIPAINVGAYVWDYLGGAKSSPPTFFNNSLKDNMIGWARFKSDGKLYYHNVWTPSCTSATRSVCQNNRAWSTTVDLAAERAEFTFWQKKLQAENVTVGPVGNPAGSVQ